MNIRPIRWLRRDDGRLVLQEEINGYWINVPIVEEKEEFSPRDRVLDRIDAAMGRLNDASPEFGALEAARMFIEVLKA